MRVLHVTTHVNIGGIGNYILSLAGALKKDGVECIVASSGGNLENEFTGKDIRAERLDIDTKFELGPKVVKSAFGIAGIIKREKIDLVHAHSRVSQVASFLACRITGTPLVTTCHGYFRKRLRGILDTWGERVVAISDAVRDHLKNDLGVPDGRIALIYNGVDADKFKAGCSGDEGKSIKRSLAMAGNGPVIGTIGRLSPVKGQRFLVEAMAAILSKHRDAEMVLVGDGPERDALESLAKSLGIEKSVHFVSSVIDTNRMLSIMDVFVFPSVKEGLGIALLEALAAGRACVASDVGGIGDILRRDSCGILVPGGDPRAISMAVTKLLEDPAGRAAMGERGRKVVREKFSLDVMSEKVAGLYREIVRGKGQGAGVKGKI